jgi:hypothetical protein
MVRPVMSVVPARLPYKRPRARPTSETIVHQSVVSSPAYGLLYICMYPSPGKCAVRKVYEASIHCRDCGTSMVRRVDRSVAPKTVQADTEGLFITKYACPHSPHAHVVTRVLTSDIVEAQ